MKCVMKRDPAISFGYLLKPSYRCHCCFMSMPRPARFKITGSLFWFYFCLFVFRIVIIQWNKSLTVLVHLSMWLGEHNSERCRVNRVHII